MWLEHVIGLSLFAGLLACLLPPRQVLGIVVVCTLYFPKWCVLNVAGLPFDLRITVGALTAIGFCFHPRSRFPLKFTVLDGLIVAIALWFAAADVHQHGFSWLFVLRECGEWVLPYFWGRFAFRGREDVDRVMPFACGAVVLFGVAGVYECFSGENPFEWIYGNRPIDFYDRKAARFGYKRAFGPVMNPIFLGSLIFILLPWTALQLQKAAIYGRPWMGWLSLPIGIAGIFSSISRAPELAIGVMAYVATMIIWKKARLAMAVLAVLGGIWLTANSRETMNWVHQAGGDRVREKHSEDVTLEVSSANSRIYLWEIYWPAMIDSGWFGFGFERTSAFPVNVPLPPKELEMAKIIRWCDNSFVLFQLRTGWPGLALWVTVLAFGVVNFVMLAEREREHGLFHACCAGMVVGMGLICLTVWLGHDLSMPFLFTLGMSSGLWTGFSLADQRQAGLAGGRSADGSGRRSTAGGVLDSRTRLGSTAAPGARWKRREAAGPLDRAGDSGTIAAGGETSVSLDSRGGTTDTNVPRDAGEQSATPPPHPSSRPIEQLPGAGPMAAGEPTDSPKS